MKTMTKRISLLLIAALLLSAFTFGVDAADIPQSQATFTFTDQAITGEGAVVSNEISGTTLTIKQAGAYTLTGSCAEGNVIIAKGVTGVTLFLNNFKLESEKAAPLSIESKAEVTIYLAGTNALNNKAVRPAKTATPAEPAADAAKTEQKAKAPAFVGAAIKVKGGAKLVVSGEGALFLGSTALKSPITVAKNAKAIMKQAVNFSRKNTKKAKKPAPAAEPAAPAAEPAAPAATEGAAATVNAKKSAKAQKNKKANNWKPLEIKAGETLSVKDAEGNEILSVVAPIDAKQVIFASEKLTSKQVYTLSAGDSQIGRATARKSASVAAQTNNKKNDKKSKKEAGKQDQPAVAPVEPANVA